jgi:hypothetical protein
MARRLLPLLAVISIVLAACGGGTPTPAGPILSDPRLILASTIAAIHDARTVHFHVAVSGTFNLALLTSQASGAAPAAGASPALLDLAGTTLDGDFDVTNRAIQATASVPTMFGLTANLVVIGGNGYIKTSLTGSKYYQLDLASLMSSLPIPSLGPAGSADPAAASARISQLEAELAKLAPPSLLADEAIGGQDSYHVQEHLASSDVGGASQVLGGRTADLTVDLWSRKSDLRPSRVVLLIDMGGDGRLTLTMDPTNYDAPLTIAAPPADQVSDKPFSLPGLIP